MKLDVRKKASSGRKNHRWTDTHQLHDKGFTGSHRGNSTIESNEGADLTASTTVWMLYEIVLTVNIIKKKQADLKGRDNNSMK